MSRSYPRRACAGCLRACVVAQLWRLFCAHAAFVRLAAAACAECAAAVPAGEDGTGAHVPRALPRLAAGRMVRGSCRGGGARGGSRPVSCSSAPAATHRIRLRRTPRLLRLFPRASGGGAGACARWCVALPAHAARRWHVAGRPAWLPALAPSFRSQPAAPPGLAPSFQASPADHHCRPCYITAPQPAHRSSPTSDSSPRRVEARPRRTGEGGPTIPLACRRPGSARVCGLLHPACTCSARRCHRATAWHCVTSCHITQRHGSVPLRS